MPSVPNKPGELQTTWVHAPAESHVWGFRLAHRCLGAKIKGVPSIRPVLEIIFTMNPDATTIIYQYLTDEVGDFGAARLFTELCLADHPGHVIDTYLKKPKVKFNRVKFSDL